MLFITDFNHSTVFAHFSFCKVISGVKHISVFVFQSLLKVEWEMFNLVSVRPCELHFNNFSIGCEYQSLFKVMCKTEIDEAYLFNIESPCVHQMYAIYMILNSPTQPAQIAVLIQ